MGSSHSEETQAGQASRGLELSEERFRLLVESVIDYAIFMLSPDGFVVSWNAGAERIRGYAEEEILGQHVSILQTPVTAIAGFAEILLDEDERRDFIRRIEANVRALEDLIDHLRTFSSLETGRVRLNPEPLGLAAQVDEVVGRMWPVSGGREVDVDVPGVEVSADRRGLQRILAVESVEGEGSTFRFALPTAGSVGA